MEGKRVDAVRNRVQILVAAGAVFARHGLNAPLDLVREEAGVGRGTLYRNFEDRAALIVALLDQSLDALERRRDALIDRDDVLFSLLSFSAEHMTGHSSALFDYLGTLPQSAPEIRRGLTRFRAVMQAPLHRAIASGLCRPDLTMDDVVLIAAMIGRVIGGQRSDVARKATDRIILLLLEGIKPRRPA